MNWLELHIDTVHGGLETVETLLSSLDIDGVVIDDETDFQEFLETTTSTGTTWTKIWKSPCRASPA